MIYDKFKGAKYFIYKKDEFYIIGKILKVCKKTIKYNLIKSDYPHSPNCKYYLIWMNIPEFFTVYNTLDDLMIDAL